MNIFPTTRLSQTLLLTAMLIGELHISTVNAQTIINTNTSGTHEDLYYTFWQDTGDASITLYDGGRYTSTFTSATNNWIGGLGWDSGETKIVNYSGTYNPAANANSYLTLFGWMNISEREVVEYYILENWGSWNPASSGTYYGSYTSDDVLYDFYRFRRNHLGIDPMIITNYYAIRRDKPPFGKVSGTIHSAKHFDAWKNMGLKLGSIQVMILATESYQGSGNSDITVSEGTSSCGTENSMPICCSIAADDDGDGYGTQFDGEMCVVTQATSGWHPANPDDIIAAINVGGLDEPIQVDGIWYESNTFVQGGISRGTKVAVTDQADNPLFTMVGLGDLSIAIPLDGPQYVSVELGFAEIQHKEVGKRVFNVNMEGETVYQGIDLVANAGPYAPWRPTPKLVEVNDGHLNINIQATTDQALLSYVLVKKATAPVESSSSSSTQTSSASGSSQGSAGGSLNLEWLLMIGVLSRRGLPLGLKNRFKSEMTK